MRRLLLITYLMLSLTISITDTPTASANTITMDGSCTLIDAIIAANTDASSGSCPAGSGADTIVLDADTNLTVPYPGSTDIDGGQAGLPDITTDITIQAGTHSIVSGNSTNFRILYVSDTGQLTLDGVEISGGRLAPASGYASGAGIFNEGALTINNSLITENLLEGGNETSGAGIYSDSNSPQVMSISNTTISNHTCVAFGLGCGAHFSGYDLSLNDVIIKDNNALNSFGGGLYSRSDTSLDGVDFINNHGDIGGGMLVDRREVALTNVTFDNNSAESDGGGLYLLEAAISAFDFVEFTNNTANSGGGVFFEPGILLQQSFTSNGFKATDNIATTYGGVMYWAGLQPINPVTVVFDDAIIQRNEAQNGGAFFIDNDQVPLTFVNATISDNHASDTGGFMWMSSSDIKFIDSHIAGNQAAMDGGAFFGHVGSQLGLMDTLLTDNSAGRDGGAIFGEISSVDFVSSTVSNNTASRYGGALAVFNYETTITNSTFSYNSADQDGFWYGELGTVWINHSTIWNNQATTSHDSLYLNVSNTFQINGSIIGSPGGVSDCAYPGLLPQVTNSLRAEGDTSCMPATNDVILPDTDIDSTLQNNGGPTTTHALIVHGGNPAIDGNPGCGLPTDQRGVNRDINCDIGAYEAGILQNAFLTASAVCDGSDLDVTISSGDALFNITASAGQNTPVTNVGIGTTTITGPEKWDNLTVTETSGDAQTINLGQFKCRTDERPVPVSPAHRSHTSNTTPTFSWTGITDANNYRVFIFDDANAATRTVDIRQNSGGPTSLTVSTPLPTMRLFWRVRGRQNRVWSLWSIRFTLFVDSAAVAPVGVTPLPTIPPAVPPNDRAVPTAPPAPPNSR